MSRYGKLGNEFLVEQSKSRKANLPGDIFTFKTRNGNYIWGRIINTNSDAGMTNLNNDYLVYIYNVLTKTNETVPELNKNDLLISPTFLGKTMWIIGYTETVERRELTRFDVFKEHYFYNVPFKCYVNNFGVKIPPPPENFSDYIIGYYGVPSLGVYDMKFREALSVND